MLHILSEEQHENILRCPLNIFFKTSSEIVLIYKNFRQLLLC